MKRKSIIIAALFLTFSATVAAQAGLIFEDDFNDSVIDPSKWVLSNAGGQDPAAVGNTVIESGGVLDIYQNSTDFGGRVLSTPIAVNPTGEITMTRSVYVNYNESYPHFRGSHMIADDTGAYIAGISHFHYDYHSWYGFGIVTQHDPVSPLLPSVFDQWFEEELTLNPVTGLVTYSMGGNSVSYQGNPFSTASITLDFHSYGWFTGHNTKIDWVTLEQDPGAPVPEPATMLLFGTGLVGLVGSRLRRKK